MRARLRCLGLSARCRAALAVPVGWRADSHAGGIDLDLMPLLAWLVDAAQSCPWRRPSRHPACGAGVFSVVRASRRRHSYCCVGWGLLCQPPASAVLAARAGWLTHEDSPFSLPDRRRATTARSPWGKPGWQAGTCSAAPEDLAAAGRRVMRAVRCQVRLWCRISCSCHADCWPARSHGRAFCGRLDPFDLGRVFNHVVGQHQQTAHFLEGAFVAAANGRLIFENRLHHPASSSRTPQSMERRTSSVARSSRSLSKCKGGHLQGSGAKA